LIALGEGQNKLVKEILLEKERVGITMHKIICPNCKESFSIEEPDYLLIASQVRNEEYRKDIEERKRDFENQMEQAVEKARLEEQLRLTKDISEKAQQIVNLQNEKETLVLDYENRL